MAKVNWGPEEFVRPADMNVIGEEINALNDQTNDLPARLEEVKEEAITAAQAMDEEYVIPQANANAQAYVNERPWQKHKLTEDDGLAKVLVTADLNTLTTTGNYYVGTATNGPFLNTNYFVEVTGGNVANSVLQRATSYFYDEVYTRQKYSASSWTPWTSQTPQPNVWGAL
ncbi:MAG: pyocin knob domain-containing protein [Aerococcus urinaeequi]